MDHDEFARRDGGYPGAAVPDRRTCTWACEADALEAVDEARIPGPAGLADSCVSRRFSRRG